MIRGNWWIEKIVLWGAGVAGPTTETRPEASRESGPGDDGASHTHATDTRYTYRDPYISEHVNCDNQECTTKRVQQAARSGG